MCIRFDLQLLTLYKFFTDTDIDINAHTVAVKFRLQPPAWLPSSTDYTFPSWCYWRGIADTQETGFRQLPAAPGAERPAESHYRGRMVVPEAESPVTSVGGRAS